MPMPLTTGQLRTKVSDMQIGDYIVCKYVATANAVGTFSELGTSVATEIALTGSNVPNGAFYFVKTAKGLLIADRVVQHSFTWDVMNTGKIIQGRPATLGTTTGKIRSLTGGVAFADANGNRSTSTTDLGFGGFPKNNEWDRFIVNFPKDMIQSGKTLDDVFHSKIDLQTWCQDTPILALFSATNKIRRGYNAYASLNGGGVSSTNVTTTGFRPVFEYKE